jgi:PAS domain S-box-containing protein
VSVADSLIQTSLLGEAVENGPTAVFVADEDGNYVAVNRAACDLLGYSREELLELSVEDLAENGGRFAEMRENGHLTGASELIRKDGTKVMFTYVAGKTVVAGMSVYVSVGAGT